MNAKTKKLILILFPLLAVISFGAYLYYKHAAEVAKYDFSVQSDMGEVKLSNFRGKQTFVYFGYGLCPDICPTTLVALSSALNELQKNELEKVEAVFISLDPQRDKPKELGVFARYFHPKIIGAAADEEYTKKIASNYGVTYKKIEQPDSSIGYSLAHSADLYLIDENGKLKSKLPFGVTPKEIVAALKK